LLTSPTNRGHNFGTTDLDNMIFNFCKENGVTYLCKASNDVLLQTILFDKEVDIVDFYYLNGISYDDLYLSKFNYEELYNNSNTSKKYKIMKQYIQNCYDCYNDTILEKDKNKNEDERLWQIKVIFHGINCCTISYLEALQALYIHYYYSIMNDREITSFRFNDITEYQINYFNYLNLDKILLKNCNFSYDKQHSYYNIRPYNFINKSNISLSNNRHIYKEICEQPFIPKFSSIEELTKLLIVEKTIEDFNIEVTPKEEIKEKVIYISKTKKDKYKCAYCERTYKNINGHIITHFREKHQINITINDLMNN
jgi:hypothetical protein